MFAIGHLALGYISGKISASMLKVDVHIPWLLVASVVSDIDLLLPGVEHRGPTHSVILLLLVSIPMIVIWRKQAIPVVISLSSHPLLGDYFTSSNYSQGVQLLFPLSENWYFGADGAISLWMPILEAVLLGIMLMLFIVTKDGKFLLRPDSWTFLLLIPIGTTLLPVFTDFPLPVPSSLIIPHILLAVILFIPVFSEFYVKTLKYHKH
jgi:membrane-bound metal-dependent hydrolase YbcI (DUF457 family)